MTDLRQEWLETIVKVLAASCGVSMSGASDVMPYNPAVLEAHAQSGRN